ncbi:hypothetical protein OKW21_004223 [Catalinimonas alkaloidigena]|uniref:hypothetical protein n=1 Tax=Catalinimonas alkaloidigena TaxID=1075417 RepID=UPI002406AA30|nr:hypothetical protein [Catalinimonas alkaloidigena]MDF9798960.1 hypothetical protein [Catalinimonas alkaloidigena]
MNTNPFKALEEEAQAPEKLGDKVMESIVLSELIMDIADLFIVKTGKTIASLFKTDQLHKNP